MDSLYNDSTTVQIHKSYQPGQSTFLQLRDESFTPEQLAPPFFGLGFVQDLFLVCVPSPQVYEHEDQRFHFDQPPATRGERKKR